MFPCLKNIRKRAQCYYHNFCISLHFTDKMVEDKHYLEIEETVTWTSLNKDTHKKNNFITVFKVIANNCTVFVSSRFCELMV